MKSDLATLQTAFDSPIDSPPDSYAAHVAELPVPGSRVLNSQSALAVALAYNALDPEYRQSTLNMLEEIHSLAEQNETLTAYSRNIYAYAMKLKDDLARTVAVKEKEIAALKHMNSTLETSGPAEPEMAELKSTIKSLTAQLEETRKEAAEANARVQSLLEKHADRAAEAGKWRVRVSELEAELKEGKTAHDGLVAEVNCYKSKVENAQREFNEFKTFVETLKPEMDEELGRVNGAHEAEMNKLKSELHHATASEKEVRTRNNALLAEAAHLKDELSSEKESHDATVKRLELELEKSRTALRREEDNCNKGERECNDLRASLMDSQKACADWNSKFQSANDTAAKQIADIQAERDAAHKHVKDWELKFKKEAETGRQMLEELNKDLTSSRHEATALNEKLEQANATAQDHNVLRSNLLVLQAKVEANESKLQLAFRERDAALEDNNSLQRRADGLKVKLRAANKALQESKDDVASLTQRSTAKCDELEEETTKLRVELAAAGTKNQEHEKTITNLSAERDSFKRERDGKILWHAQQSESLNQRLLKAESQAETRSQKINDMTKEMKLLEFNSRSHISGLEKRLEEAQLEGAQAMNRADQRYTELQQSHVQAQEKIRVLEDALRQAQSKHEAQRDSCTTEYDSKLELDCMRATLETKAREISDLRSENDRLCTDIDDFERERDKLSTLVDQLKQERAGTEDSCKSLTTKVQLHKKQYESAQAELDALKIRLQQLADNATDESCRFSAEVARLNAQVNAQRDELAAQTVECERLQAVVRRLQTQVDEQRETIDRERFYAWRQRQ